MRAAPHRAALIEGHGRPDSGKLARNRNPESPGDTEASKTIPAFLGPSRGHERGRPALPWGKPRFRFAGKTEGGGAHGRCRLNL